MRSTPSLLVSVLALALALPACSTTWGDKAVSTDDTGGGDGGGDDGAGTVDGIDGFTDSLDTSGCEEVQGSDGEMYPVPGAAGYFAGSYAATGEGTWRGVEQWLLFANEAWRETGEGDCTITWSVVASETDNTGACAACDLGLEVSGTIDQSNTDCPAGLWEDDRNWTASYAILRSGDGTAQWYYAASGTPLGAGDHDSAVLEFLSDKSCNWF